MSDENTYAKPWQSIAMESRQRKTLAATGVPNASQSSELGERKNLNNGWLYSPRKRELRKT